VGLEAARIIALSVAIESEPQLPDKQQNKALHPTAYSSVRRASSLRFQRRVSWSLCSVRLRCSCRRLVFWPLFFRRSCCSVSVGFVGRRYFVAFSAAFLSRLGSLVVAVSPLVAQRFCRVRWPLLFRFSWREYSVVRWVRRSPELRRS
jgi:hypothetical protein